MLFDINRTAKFGPLFSSASEAVLARILPAPPRQYRTAIITNADLQSSEVVARITEAGSVTEQVYPLGLSYPNDIYSLSHVALPFPISDSLYGTAPDKSENFGINLGSLAPRGERGALVVNLDTLLRISSNPFYP
ncbi:hypothetical protein, partial [Corallococcus exiguus]|uniref:hypothetical protein n=1 Tax=Corallococcus exiguus TaxID=83462 RepID=UPI001B8C01D9